MHCYEQSMHSSSDEYESPNTSNDSDFKASITFAFRIPHNTKTESHPLNTWTLSIDEDIDL